MGKITQIIDAAAWRPWALAGALAVVSAASVFSLDAWARDEAVTPDASGMHAMHQGRPPMGRPDGMGMMPLGGRHLDHLLDEVKATDAQRTQIKALAQSAEADLKPLHEQGRSLHEQTLALFGQPQVDAAAAEKLPADAGQPRRGQQALPAGGAGHRQGADARAARHPGGQDAKAA